MYFWELLKLKKKKTCLFSRKKITSLACEFKKNCVAYYPETLQQWKVATHASRGSGRRQPSLQMGRQPYCRQPFNYTATGTSSSAMRKAIQKHQAEADRQEIASQGKRTKPFETVGWKQSDWDVQLHINAFASRTLKKCLGVLRLLTQ